MNETKRVYEGFPDGVSDEFCQFVTAAKSQYGTTARALAAEVLHLRSQLRALQRPSCGTKDPDSGYECELEAGHEGEHVAFITVAEEYRSLIPKRHWSGRHPDACETCGIVHGTAPCPGVYKGGSC